MSVPVQVVAQMLVRTLMMTVSCKLANTESVPPWLNYKKSRTSNRVPRAPNDVVAVSDDVVTVSDDIVVAVSDDVVVAVSDDVVVAVSDALDTVDVAQQKKLHIASQKVTLIECILAMEKSSETPRQSKIDGYELLLKDAMTDIDVIKASCDWHAPGQQEMFRTQGHIANIKKVAKAFRKIFPEYDDACAYDNAKYIIEKEPKLTFDEIITLMQDDRYQKNLGKGKPREPRDEEAEADERREKTVCAKIDNEAVRGSQALCTVPLNARVNCGEYQLDGITIKKRCTKQEDLHTKQLAARNKMWNDEQVKHDVANKKLNEAREERAKFRKAAEEAEAAKAAEEAEEKLRRSDRKREKAELSELANASKKGKKGKKSSNTSGRSEHTDD